MQSLLYRLTGGYLTQTRKKIEASRHIYVLFADRRNIYTNGCFLEMSQEGIVTLEEKVLHI